MSAPKSVFISYRRKDIYVARSVYYELLARNYDVFIDYQNIASGDWMRTILDEIDARAHFLAILTPTALKRCTNPNDVFAREIRRAILKQRNIIPLKFSTFDWKKNQQYLHGPLSILPGYQDLFVPDLYFEEAMERLHVRYLSKSPDEIPHPPLPEESDNG